MMSEKKLLRQLNNESGFTLLEMIITIAIVAIVAGISGFGLNGVFNANLKNISYDTVSDMRSIRFRSVSEFDTAYQLVLTYDSASERYGYEIQRMAVGDSAPSVIETKDFRSSLVIMREDSSGNWVELSDPSIDITLHPERATFCFNTSTGGISEYVLNSSTTNVESLNLSGGNLGKYKFVNTRNGQEVRFDIVGLTEGWCYMKSKFQNIIQGLLKYANNEQGLSAVEMMAAVVIAGLVIGSLTAYLTTHIRSFETTVDVIDVQYEGQLAYNALGKVAMESTGISFVYDGTIDQTPTSLEIVDPLSIVFENSDGSAYNFYFDKANKKIIFKREELDANKKTLDITADDWYDFAFNVSSWTINPGIHGYTYSGTDHIQIEMIMEDGDITLNLSNLYKMRNKVN